MLNRIAGALALAALFLAPSARAETLGETMNLALDAAGAAALTQLPPETLGAVQSVSQLRSAHALGLVEDDTAALALATLIDELAFAQPALTELDAAAFRAAMIVQSRVVVAGARELARSLPAGPDRALLIGAAARLVDAIALVVDQRIDAGSDGPDNPCFQNYAGCMEYCANLQDFISRTLCGMDCNLDFAACLGRVVGSGLGSLIDGIGTIAKPRKGK